MFYKEYLGIDKAPEDEVTIYVSKQRERPLNKHWIYCLILTDYQGKRIVSTSTTMEPIILNCIIAYTKGRTIAQTYDTMKTQDWGLRLSYMYRMFRDQDQLPKLPENKKVNITYCSECRKSIAIIGGEPVGYCKISDVYGVYGNIAVWVDESYCKQGIASLLLNDNINGLILTDLVKMRLQNIRKSLNPQHILFSALQSKGGIGNASNF